MDIILIGVFEIIIGGIILRDVQKKPVKKMDYLSLNLRRYIAGVGLILVGIITIIDAI